MNAQCIMVCSGKGGTGKSTVSVLLGACLARLGRKTLLVELDSGLRSVDIIAGVYGRTVYDIEDVLCGRCEGAKAVVPSPLYPGLSVISAPYEGGAVDAAPLGRLLVAMRPYFDFVILDTAAGMGAPFTAAAAATGLPLAEEDETLAIIPAAYGTGVIDHMLDEFDTLILLKVKPLLDEVLELLDRRGLLATSCFIEKVGSPEQRIVRDLASLKGETVNYLSLLLVQNPKRQRGELRRGCRRRKETQEASAV